MQLAYSLQRSQIKVKTYYKIDGYEKVTAEPYKEYFDSNQYYRQVSGGDYQSLRDIAEDPSSGTTGWYIEEKTSSFEPFLFLSNATYEIVKLTEEEFNKNKTNYC